MRSRPNKATTGKNGPEPPAAPEPKGAQADAAARAPKIRSRLLRAYDEGKRELPWRGETDPYRIWVSEIMLQQTRVETVIPYYKAWLDQFPTLEALAGAEETEVLRAWQGLGYYSRARNLHRGARVVRDRFHGELPQDPETLRSLPGVGEYTAGALASIAFDRVAAAVDGNVRRVLSRLFDLPKPGQAELRSLATELVDPSRPGDFNQALMELGALICTPRSPDCGECPLKDHCAALASGTVEERPAGKERKPVPEVHVAVLVMAAQGRALDGPGTLGDGSGSHGDGPGSHDDSPGRDKGPEGGVRFFLRRRPPEGLLARMWEFPGIEMGRGKVAMETTRPGASMEEEVEVTGGGRGRKDVRGTGEKGPKVRSDPSTLNSALVGLARELGLESDLAPEVFDTGTTLSVVRHAFTHMKVSYRPVLLRIARVGEEAGEGLNGPREVRAPLKTGTEGGMEVGMEAGTTRPGDGVAGWFTPSELNGLPLPVAQEKIFRAALEALDGVEV